MTLAALHAEMARLARQLPEYDTVHAMYGVGEITAAQLMYSLQPIRQEANYSILLETLAAYLLDAGENLQRTAEVLGVHKNTVRYRLNQIRASYACEISQMPLVAELYEAVALQRLLSNN